MVRIPNIKIPSVRVGSIGLTSNIGTGGATPAPPTPITYLTQWKIVGNSEVHTDPYLTSWKVSGNSVVDNNTILSCGDLGQDGKYHVKISNGVDIYDIALDEPLRKVNDVADTIEFPSGTDGKALVTRNLNTLDLGSVTPDQTGTSRQGEFKWRYNKLGIKIVDNAVSGNILCAIFPTASGNGTYSVHKTSISNALNGADAIMIFDEEYCSSGQAATFQAARNGVEVIYELNTPTTELVDAPQIAVSPTDTYTSANVVPYSAFEHTENKEIWSCGEHNATDGKYHILVQPLGGSIADIALDEPLRKVNDVADTIEFPSETEGKALVTRRLGSVILGDVDTIGTMETDKRDYNRWTFGVINNIKLAQSAQSKAILMCATLTNVKPSATYTREPSSIAASSSFNMVLVYKEELIQSTPENVRTYFSNTEVVYELATPTTKLVDAPQIEEAESYTCEITQGGKAVSWSSFDTDSE